MPSELGDSSVFGWQIMALHSAEQLGFKIPQETLDGAKRYISSCGQGRYKLLAGYQPHQSPTTPMTAELLFSRMLLGMPMSDDGVEESTRFLARQPPDPQRRSLLLVLRVALDAPHAEPAVEELERANARGPDRHAGNRRPRRRIVGHEYEVGRPRRASLHHRSRDPHLKSTTAISRCGSNRRRKNLMTRSQVTVFLGNPHASVSSLHRPPGVWGFRQFDT